jgi:hypothetical protein
MCLPVINSLMLQPIQPKVQKNFCTLRRSNRGVAIRGEESVKVDLHCVKFQNFKWVKQFLSSSTHTHTHSDFGLLCTYLCFVLYVTRAYFFCLTTCFCSMLTSATLRRDLHNNECITLGEFLSSSVKHLSTHSRD